MDQAYFAALASRILVRWYSQPDAWSPYCADTPVSRTISKIDSFCRKCILGMKFNSPMWITPLALPPTALGKVHMAQWSVKFIRLNGAVLDANQPGKQQDRFAQKFPPDSAVATDVEAFLEPLNRC